MSPTDSLQPMEQEHQLDHQREHPAHTVASTQSAPVAGVLTPSQLDVLAAVQDRLIPREGELPGAGESGAAHRVDGYLAVRPEWRADLLAALQAIEVAAAAATHHEQALSSTPAEQGAETVERVQPVVSARVVASRPSPAGEGQAEGQGEVCGDVGQPNDQVDPAGASFAGFLTLSPAQRDTVLHTVEAAQPRLFYRLLRLTYTVYYTDAVVQHTHGFATEPPLPRGHTLRAFDEARLEPVKRRGKLWRDA